ncbi:unnamed protein product [Polarella glacialis]|uniref:Triosephosphate isomerase n=1 Tax=Polarella glacialis TaxID=89957 RepID=A0A813LIB7_POLGL|nr:unnamed protein product [Polarella glacialis]
MARKPIVGGNWKCNPDSMSKLDELIANINNCDTSKCDVYVCPSPLHVTYCMDKVTNGAHVMPQNCNFKGCGAYTGEMAVEQMKDLKIGWVLIGHSERREFFGETDTMLAQKLKYILDAGMKCVFCIGEKLPEREKGLEATMAVCISQMEQIKGLMDPEKVVIAYEPVWAIGTGVTATAEQAQEPMPPSASGSQRTSAQNVRPAFVSSMEAQQMPRTPPSSLRALTLMASSWVELPSSLSSSTSWLPSVPPSEHNCRRNAGLHFFIKLSQI